MRRCLGVLLGFIAASFACPPTALAQEETAVGYNSASGNAYVPAYGPYIGAAGGGSFLQDISPHGGGADVNSRYNDSYIGRISLGYGWGNGFRTELEGSYFRNDVSSVRGARPNAVSGAVGVVTIMLNQLYDFDPDQWGLPNYGVVPHVGIGLGWARPRFDHAASYNGLTLSGKDDLLAYQAIVGIDYALDRDWRLGFDYRYLGTDDGHFDATPGTPGSKGATATSFGNHAVLVELRYELNPPSRPPPAPAMPPPPLAATAAPVSQPEARRDFQIFFYFDRATIGADAARILLEAADTVKSGHVARIRVIGHTDTAGSTAYNLELSRRRAEAVQRQLLADGLSGDEITTEGAGKSGLLVPTPGGVREPQNRRAEILLGAGQS